MDALAGSGGDDGASQTGKINTGVFVEIFVFDCNGGLFSVFGNLGAFYNETIVLSPGVFPENDSVTIEIFIDGF